MHLRNMVAMSLLSFEKKGQCYMLADEGKRLLKAYN